MKVIVPCAEPPKADPSQLPRWALPWRDGRPMLALAISDLGCNLDDVIVTVLEEHEQRHQVQRGLQRLFGRDITTVTLEKATRSEVETVYQTLRKAGIDEPFFVKDSDNRFHMNELEAEFDYVCINSLNQHDAINPRNKSYLRTDADGYIRNIREQVVIADTFCVGGYFFRSASRFCNDFEVLEEAAPDWERQLYLSDIIGAMILGGREVRTRTAEAYEDWGSTSAWRRALQAQHTYFVALDGLLFERGSAYFAPHFDQVQSHPNVVETLHKLVERGHTLIYLSIRPSDTRELTEQQLRNARLPHGHIVFNCPVGPWVMLTAPHPTLPFRTGEALECPPHAFSELSPAERALPLEG